jgi:hypothetical protein
MADRFDGLQALKTRYTTLILCRQPGRPDGPLSGPAGSAFTSRISSRTRGAGAILDFVFHAILGPREPKIARFELVVKIGRPNRANKYHTILSCVFSGNDALRNEDGAEPTDLKETRAALSGTSGEHAGWSP